MCPVDWCNDALQGWEREREGERIHYTTIITISSIEEHHSTCTVWKRIRSCLRSRLIIVIKVIIGNSKSLSRQAECSLIYKIICIFAFPSSRRPHCKQTSYVCSLNIADELSTPIHHHWVAYLSKRIFLFIIFYVSRITTIFITLSRVISTVALFVAFNNFVAAKRPIIHLKTVFFALIVEHSTQHRRNIVDRTVREFIVVLTFAAGGRRIHDKVPEGTTWSTLHWVVMGRAEIVSNLMSQC